MRGTRELSGECCWRSAGSTRLNISTWHQSSPTSFPSTDRLEVASWPLFTDYYFFSFRWPCWSATMGRSTSRTPLSLIRPSSGRKLRNWEEATDLTVFDWQLFLINLSWKIVDFFYADHSIAYVPHLIVFRKIHETFSDYKFVFYFCSVDYFYCCRKTFVFRILILRGSACLEFSQVQPTLDGRYFIIYHQEGQNVLFHVSLHVSLVTNTIGIWKLELLS